MYVQVQGAKNVVGMCKLGLRIYNNLVFPENNKCPDSLTMNVNNLFVQLTSRNPSQREALKNSRKVALIYRLLAGNEYVRRQAISLNLENMQGLVHSKLHPRESRIKSANYF